MKYKNQRLRILLTVGVWLLILIPMLSCGSVSNSNPTPVATAPSNYPDTEIVYDAWGDLGFVSQDGLNMTTIAIDPGEDFYHTWKYPLITSDGKMLFVTFTSVPGIGGEIVALPEGEFPIRCGWQGVLRLVQDGLHVWVNTGVEIDEYLITDCGTGNPPKIVYAVVENDLDVLSPDKRYIAKVIGGEMGVEEHIVVRDLVTGEEMNLGNGSFPAWSQDGDRLAFTGADGIYLYHNTPDAVPSRLVYLENVGPNVGAPVYQADRFRWYFPPIASWSPDGLWIVYHVCLEMKWIEGGGWDEHYSIYKTNVETGETVELADNGVSPFWHWPAQP